jgi:hypothetical protein
MELSQAVFVETRSSRIGGVIATGLVTHGNIPYEPESKLLKNKLFGTVQGVEFNTSGRL